MAGSVAAMNLLDAALVAFLTHGVAIFEATGGVSGWCRLNGVSRATFYRHRERISATGSWAPRSRAPRCRPTATDPRVVAAIVRLRASLGGDNGAVTIHYHLGQDPALAGFRVPCPATIHKILRREGLVVPEPRKRPKSSWRRFSYARPRDCYQIDATVVTLAGGVKATVFEVLDDCTRVLVATHAAAGETSAGAITAIRGAFTGFGVPAIVLSDNGSAFTSRCTGGGTSQFTRVVTAAGARLIHASPYHPQTCGKVERHHRTFKTWLAGQPTPATLAELQRLCTAYQQWYNTTRPHSAVKMPPLQAWQRALDLGGPQHLPLQQDAAVFTRTVNAVGVVRCQWATVSVGKGRAGERVTVIRDGRHLTIYDDAGQPLGHVVIDPTKTHQGRLSPAA